MTIFSKNWGGMAHFPPWLRLWVHVGSLVSHASNFDRSQHGSRSLECMPWWRKSLWPERLLISSWFHWEAGMRMDYAFSVRVTKLEPEGACTLLCVRLW